MEVLIFSPAMGLASSGDLFKLNTDEVIWGCPDIHKSMDNVLWQGVGNTVEEARPQEDGAEKY